MGMDLTYHHDTKYLLSHFGANHKSTHTSQQLKPFYHISISSPPLPCERDLIYHCDTKYFLPHKGQTIHLFTLHNNLNPYPISISPFYLNHSHMREI